MRFFIYTSIFFIAFMFAVVPSVDAAFGLEQTVGEVQKGSDITFQTDIPTVVGNIIGTALSLISVAFFILMIYGGLRWMFSRGNEDEAKKALDIIIAAIIGMLIVLGSYAITTFVFKSVGGGEKVDTNAPFTGSQSEGATGPQPSNSGECKCNVDGVDTVLDSSYDLTGCIEVSDTIGPLGEEYTNCQWFPS